MVPMLPADTPAARKRLRATPHHHHHHPSSHLNVVGALMITHFHISSG